VHYVVLPANLQVFARAPVFSTSPVTATRGKGPRPTAQIRGQGHRARPGVPAWGSYDHARSGSTRAERAGSCHWTHYTTDLNTPHRQHVVSHAPRHVLPDADPTGAVDDGVVGLRHPLRGGRYDACTSAESSRGQEDRPTRRRDGTLMARVRWGFVASPAGALAGRGAEALLAKRTERARRQAEDPLVRAELEARISVIGQDASLSSEEKVKQLTPMLAKLRGLDHPTQIAPDAREQRPDETWMGWQRRIGHAEPKASAPSKTPAPPLMPPDAPLARLGRALSSAQEPKTPKAPVALQKLPDETWLQRRRREKAANAS